MPKITNLQYFNKAILFGCLSVGAHWCWRPSLTTDSSPPKRMSRPYLRTTTALASRWRAGTCTEAVSRPTSTASTCSETTWAGRREHLSPERSVDHQLLTLPVAQCWAERKPVESHFRLLQWLTMTVMSTDALVLYCTKYCFVFDFLLRNMVCRPI